MRSRRTFIKDGALALVSLGFAPSFLTRTVAAARAGRRKVLVAIFQRGAMDGLNAVVPFGDMAYRAPHKVAGAGPFTSGRRPAGRMALAVQLLDPLEPLFWYGERTQRRPLVCGAAHAVPVRPARGYEIQLGGQRFEPVGYEGVV